MNCSSVPKHVFWAFQLFLLSLFWSARTQATHIVGGELEFVHVGKFTYDARLILYFDQVNGLPGAEDNSVNIGIFAKSFNSLVDTFILPKTQVDFVQYSFPDCAIPALNTKRIIYSKVVTLDSFTYSDPAGYYLAWDRCCRNNVINNLIGPGTQGQLFYLEIPPIYLNGQEFINTTPILFPPVSDYACNGDLFYYDFKGTDVDGDSLVYSMVNPLKGLTGPGQPIFPSPLPGPYPEVIWDNNHGLNNMINGNPNLNITTDGFLSVKPSETGLFVFGVKCEEFRNGTKIGEVRRDFQIYVINCPSNDPPAIAAEDPMTNSNLSDGDTIQITQTDRCFTVDVWDPDPDTKMTIEAVALNFDPSFIYPTQKNANAVGRDTISTTVCFSKCAITENEPYEFWVIVSDDGCALPKKDTIRLYAWVDGFGFQVPGVFSTTGSDTLKLIVGEEVSFEVSAVDNVNDSIDLILLQSGWDPFYLGATFPSVSGTDTITSTFTWTPDCRALDVDSSFLVFKGFDHICTNYDSLLFLPFQVEYIPQKPLISTSLGDGIIQANINQTYNFQALALDSNKGEILQMFIRVLGEEKEGIPPGPFDYSPRTAQQNLISDVNWRPGCDFFGRDSAFLRIMVLDNGCVPQVDSLDVKAVFLYENEHPELTIEDVSDDPSIDNYSFLINPIDTSIHLELVGFDADSDLVFLTASGVGFELEDFEMDFLTASNYKTAGGSFDWRIPGCGLLNYEPPLQMYFGIKDGSCEQIEDSILVQFEWENPWKDLEPPNVITPNGDGFNDYLSLEQIKAPCEFEKISIYGRWGNLIYQTSDPDFLWNPDELPEGQYMYHIVFNNFEQKGYVNLMR